MKAIFDWMDLHPILTFFFVVVFLGFLWMVIEAIDAPIIEEDEEDFGKYKNKF